MSSLKKIGFLSALILPVLLLVGVYLGGANLLLIHFFVFILVPLMVFLIARDKKNVPAAGLLTPRVSQLLRALWDEAEEIVIRSL